MILLFTQYSGLSEWIGLKLAVFSDFPAWAMVLLICLIVAGFTEVASNTATATIFLPILAELVRHTTWKYCYKLNVNKICLLCNYCNTEVVAVV